MTNVGEKSSSRIGFIQGRLSPIEKGRIQSFPWETWEEEFETATRISLKKVEWTIDSENFSSNPLLTSVGREAINRIKSLHNIDIPSITCDYFMENPPWKSHADRVFIGIKSILLGMVDIDSKILVVPLVDNSSLGSQVKAWKLETFFRPITKLLRKNDIRIAFETDLSPESFPEFINEFDKDLFGINYDIGNSASLGYNPKSEIESYGDWIINVHVKDRVLGGSTVPLGEGSADFETVFGTLASINYAGNFILQTARSSTGDHVGVIEKYRDMTLKWMDRYGL